MSLPVMHTATGMSVPFLMGLILFVNNGLTGEIFPENTIAGAVERDVINKRYAT